MVTLLPLAQLASVGGVYRLSWLLAILHACFALAAVQRGPRPDARPVAAALGLLTVTSLWGVGADQRAAALTREGTPVRVGLIQAQHPAGARSGIRRARATIFERYLQMTREAAAKGAQFILWPESATPFYFDEDPPAAEHVRAPGSGDGDAVAVRHRRDRARDRRDRYYNSAFMLDPAGATAAVYRKMFLVPFGEYVPFGTC